MAADDQADRNRAEAKKLMATIDDERANRLLKGAYDLHVHSGPSTMPRQVDHLQAAEEAVAAGMKGVLFKDHHYSVAPVIPLLERVLDKPDFSMFSGLVLNNSTGGFNPYVVDAQLKMGAKLIWMPTAQAGNHVRSAHRKTRLASNVQLRNSPLLSPLDSLGNVLDEVKQILDMIAEFDVILSSGHLHVWEIWKLFDEARARGVKRLLINHPMYGLHFTYADIRDLARLGAVVEQSATMYVDSRFNTYSPQELKGHIDAAGVENSSIGSDLGQVDTPTPVEGMRQAIKLCLALGYSDDDVRTMVATNPARLVGQKG
jgi:hypothetical protein